MKGLYRYLSPFAPDQSGAVSVLFELGGIIVICDAGGCTGNICGFDEPRWQSQKSAVFSAGLRDMDAILGRDERLLDKIENALESVDAQFVALVGTPVPAVIGTDFRALRHMAEKRFGLPVVTVETTGMDTYSVGQEKAYTAVFETFPPSAGPETVPGCFSADSPFTGIWGATPLDLAAPDSAELLRARLAARGQRVVTYGMDGTLADIRRCAAARQNVVVSPSGLKPAQILRQRFGTPFSVEPLLPPVPAAVSVTGPVLVVHQQFMANTVRNLLRSGNSGSRIDVATFFTFAAEYAEPGDCGLSEEDAFVSLVRDRGYRTLIADPLFRRALPDFTGRFIPLPHFAVSGQLYAAPDERSFLTPLLAGTGREKPL
jgi:nitrogenase molybdenum-cofactor synthesis protein NifE